MTEPTTPAPERSDELRSTIDEGAKNDRTVASAAAAPNTRSVVWMALSFAAGAAALALVLYVQHVNHGWPFSLHHGMAAGHGGMASAYTALGDAGTPSGTSRAEVTVAPDRLDALGVAVATVEETPLASELRAVATIVPDESRVSHVHTRVSGWIDRLSVRTTGASVRAGETLGSIFSRELLASQTEYLTALHAAGATSPIARGARDRLHVLGMTDDEIATVERRGSASSNVPILAPRAGVVLHRGVTAGAAVDPSTELFVIADLSVVWVLAEVPEARMTDVVVGSSATIEIATSGVAPIESTVAFVYPTLTEGTRTLRVRFALDNASGVLRPGTYGSATFHLTPRTSLTVPRDAIVDTGLEQHVFVATDGDRFVPRTVRVGARLGDRIEILDGLSEGERVVASGVFLLDSESRLRASGGAATHDHGGHAPPPAGSEAPEHDDMADMPGMGH